MEDKGVSKKTIFIIVLIVSVFVSVFGGLKLSGIFDADKNSTVQEKEAKMPEDAPVNLFLKAKQVGTADFFEAGKQIGALMRDENDKIVVIIDEKYEITKNQVQISAIMQEAYNSADPYSAFSKNRTGKSDTMDLTKEEILQELIKTKVIVSEAIKQGFTVSDSEAEAAIEAPYQQMQEALAHSSDQERAAAKRSMELLETLVAGIEMTKEEYKRAIQVPSMKEALLKQALRDAFAARLSNEERMDQQTVERKYEAYVQKLLSQAKIKRLDESLFSPAGES